MDADFFDVVVKNPFDQLVGWLCVRQSIFLGPGDDQAGTFSHCLKILVVIRSASTAILNIREVAAARTEQGHCIANGIHVLHDTLNGLHTEDPG